MHTQVGNQKKSHCHLLSNRCYGEMLSVNPVARGPEITRPPISSDLAGTSPRRDDARGDAPPGSVMTHPLFSSVTALTDDTSYAQVRTTGWQIRADRAGSQIFNADLCSLTACCYEFCSRSQLGREKKKKKTTVATVSAGSWSMSALPSGAFQRGYYSLWLRLSLNLSPWCPHRSINCCHGDHHQVYWYFLFIYGVIIPQYSK